MNPFRYRPAEIAKALVAVVTSVIALCGILAASFSTGATADVGAWAAGLAVFLTPALVFLRRAEGIAEVLAPPDDSTSGRHAE